MNLVRKDLARKGEILAPDEIAAALRTPIAAVIPEEDRFFLDNISDRSRAFRTLAAVMADVGRKESFWSKRKEKKR